MKMKSNKPTKVVRVMEEDFTKFQYLNLLEKTLTQPQLFSKMVEVYFKHKGTKVPEDLRKSDT